MFGKSRTLSLWDSAVRGRNSASHKFGRDAGSLWKASTSVGDAARVRRGLTGDRPVSLPPTSFDLPGDPSAGGPADNKPSTYRQAAAAVGVCEVTVARAARAGRVKSLRVGRRVFLPDAELRRLQVEGF